MARYEPLDFEYKLTTTFSLGILLRSYEWELPNPEYYMQLLKPLDNINVPP